MEQKSREPGIKGVVADIIHVQKDYEVAIETALAEVSRILLQTMNRRRSG